MTVYRPKGEKGYKYDFTFGALRYEKRTGLTTRREAEEAEAAHKRRLRRQRAGLESENAEDTPTFSDWAATTLKFQIERKRLKRPDGAENSLRMILAFWGTTPTKTTPVADGEYRDLRLGDPIAQPELIGEFEAWMTARGISGARKNHYRSACSMLYRVALLPEHRRESGVTLNPFAGVLRDRVSRRTRILSIEDLQHWALTAPIEVAVGVAIGALTPALRLGNVVALERAAHLAHDLSYLTVPHKADRETGLPLTVALPAQLQAIVRQLILRDPKDPYVVPLGAGERYWKFTKRVRLSIKAAGWPYGRTTGEGVTFHTLRHTMQTLMARWGVPRHERQRSMGHATSAMSSWYEHLGGADTLSAARVVDQRLAPMSATVLRRLGKPEPLMLTDAEAADVLLGRSINRPLE